MANVERVRERPPSPPAEQYFREKTGQGWRLVAIEWERDAAGPAAEQPAAEEVPYGLRIDGERLQLLENSAEKLALMRMMELIVQDAPLPQVAAELNRDGYRTRQGAPWTPTAIFNLLPRLIDAGPRILTDDEYVARKQSGR